MHYPTDRIAHTTTFVTPVVEHWLERETAQWVNPMKDRSDDTSHHERTLLPRSYISLPHTHRKEGNALFNDALNTFYLRLYGIGYMVNDHSDSERENPLPSHRLLFPLAARIPLYASSHRQDNTYHGLCYTSRGTLAGTKNSS